MRIQATAEDIRSNSSLRTALGQLRYVASLDHAIEAIHDSAIRGTDNMDPEVVAQREAFAKIAAKIVAIRLVAELNYALANLEKVSVYEQ